jgi:xanthine dehydrogenase YagR molybdenum-binding subunit
MVWGIGMALTETSKMDHRFGRFTTRNLADYLLPVHADVPSIDALFIPEEDPYVNELGVKGIGEIGIVGAAVAIGNAIFNATGKRLRSLPIRVEQLIAV